MNHWYHPIVDADGNLQAGCQVSIFNQATGAPAMGYGRDGVAIGTTPTFTNGVADIYLPGGIYKFVVTAPGYSETFYNEHVGNAAGSDVGVVNYAGYTYTFEAETSAPPSTAAIRADAVDLTAATELYIDDHALNGHDFSSILLSLAPVTGYATNQIILTDPSNGAQFVANVTAVSDDTDYVTLTISGGVGATSMTVGSVKMNLVWGGKSGANAGYRLQFSTTTTDADPGAGKFRADNVTYGSITKLWVNEADYDGLDITSWLTSFDDNVNAIGRGNLIIQDQGDTATKFGFSVTGPVVDKTGYREIPVSPMSGAMPANDTIMIANFTPSGADGGDGSDGANGIDGASNFTRVRVVDTSEGSPASDYEAGDTVDGVALAENDLVLRATSAGDPADGVYLVPASGAASRLTAFNSYDSMPGTGLRTMEGAAKANTVWFCESAQGGTLDTTDLVFAEFSGSGGGGGGATSTKTSAYTTTAGDDGATVLCDASGGAFTVTHLAAATAGDSYSVTIKKTDSSGNAVTIDGNASETIEGEATYILYEKGDSVTLVCDGSNLRIKSSHQAGIRQVAHHDFDDQSAITSTSWADITGSSFTFTPRSPNSTLIITVSLNWAHQNSHTGGIRLLQDSTPLGEGGGTGFSAFMSSRVAETYTARDQAKTTMVVLSSAAAITFKLQARNFTSGSVYINRSQSNSAAYQSAGLSSITILERF